MNTTKNMMAIAINKSICKEYSNNSENYYTRTVYLNDGDEFQIQLFNPQKFVIAAEIYINGDKLSNRLILNPGQRVWLERYLDNKHKFKFSTYEVEGNDADVKQAIKDNGDITVKFYKETRTKDFNNYKLKNYDITFTNGNSTGLDTIYSSPSWSINNLNDTITTAYYSSASTIEPSFSTISASCSLNSAISTLDSYTTTASTNTINIKNDDMICETGRIEEGSVSTQEFETVDKSFEYFAFKTEKIKLLPSSQKPYTAGDLQKLYCTECGKKIKTQFKFCPYCGTEVD